MKLRLLHLALTGSALALVAWLLPACGMLWEDSTKPHNCVTDCGARLFESTDCEGFQGAETRAITHGLVTCPVLHDWNVTALPMKEGDSFVDSWGRKVGGLSGCARVSYLFGRSQNGWAVVFSDWHALSYFVEAVHHAECPIERASEFPGWPREAIASAAQEGAR